MKTVVFFGSPHRYGHTAALLRELTSAIGGEVTVFDAYSGALKPCLDCGACRTAAHCSVGDGGAEVLCAVREADCIVIAAPIHFSSLPGMLSAMASRLQYVWMRRQAGENPLGDKIRRGVICLSGGGSGGPRRALEEARCFLKMMGAEVVAEITSLQTDTLPATDDPAAHAAIAHAVAVVRGERI